MRRLNDRLEVLEAHAQAGPQRVWFIYLHVQASDYRILTGQAGSDADRSTIMERYGICFAPSAKIQWCAHVFDDGDERLIDQSGDPKWRGCPAYVADIAKTHVARDEAFNDPATISTFRLVDNRNGDTRLRSWVTRQTETGIETARLAQRAT